MEGILEIRDNGGRTFDRYTVVYITKSGKYNDARGMSEHPNHPQGFGQFCQAIPGDHLGQLITFDELPIDCQKLVLFDLL